MKKTSFMYLHFQFLEATAGTNVIPPSHHKYRCPLEQARYFTFRDGNLLCQWQDTPKPQDCRIWVYHFCAGAEGLTCKVSSRKDLASLFYILEGEAVLQLNGQHLRLQAGRHYLIRVPAGVCYPLHLQGSFCAVQVDLSPALLDLLIDTYPDAGRLQHAMRQPLKGTAQLWSEGRYNYQVRHLLEDLLTCRPEPEASFGLYLHTTVGKLMELYRQQISHLHSGDTYVFWEDLCCFIRENIGDPELMSLLRNHFPKGERSLQRLFRSHGQTPGEYIREQRMEKAAQLLRQTNLSIATIAEQVAMADVASLGKAFRKHYHISPSAFRKRK